MNSAFLLICANCDCFIRNSTVCVGHHLWVEMCRFGGSKVWRVVWAYPNTEMLQAHRDPGHHGGDKRRHQERTSLQSHHQSSAYPSSSSDSGENPSIRCVFLHVSPLHGGPTNSPWTQWPPLMQLFQGEEQPRPRHAQGAGAAAQGFVSTSLLPKAARMGALLPHSDSSNISL